MQIPIHHGQTPLGNCQFVFTTNDHPETWYSKKAWEGSPLQRRLTENGSQIIAKMDRYVPGTGIGVIQQDNQDNSNNDESVPRGRTSNVPIGAMDPEPNTITPLDDPSLVSESHVRTYNTSGYVI